ncbi:MAG: ankyrin repeat domain-containing protein [Cellvibrionales bacterium]|nr:ankyrin repeat domain-containing protein [Cellvibrionales bacterium]
MNIKLFFRYIAFLLAVPFVFSNDLINNMEKSEKKWAEKSRKTSLKYMDLSVMFPDKKIQSIAKYVKSNKTNEVKKFVQSGGNLNYQGTSGATLLYWAMREKNRKGFLMMLKLGADPNINIGNMGTIVHLSASLEDNFYLKKALKYGGDPNIHSEYLNQTPIFKVIGAFKKKNDIEALQLLIDYGADINAKSLELTPVAIAARQHRYDLVHLLLDKGAKTNNTNFDFENHIKKSMQLFKNGRTNLVWLQKIQAQLDRAKK